MKLENIEGIGEETVKRLNTLGIRTTEDVKKKGIDYMINIKDIGSGKLALIFSASNIEMTEPNIKRIRTEMQLHEIPKTSIKNQSKPKMVINTKKKFDDYEPEQIMFVLNENEDLWCQGETTDDETLISVLDMSKLENKLEKQLNLDKVDLTAIFEYAFDDDEIIVDVDGFYKMCDNCCKYVDTELHIEGYHEDFLMCDGTILCEECGIEENPKIYAIAQVTDAETQSGEICESSYDSDTFEVEDKEFKVLTDAEADDAVKEYLEETLWACNADFIASHADPEIDKLIEKYEERQSEFNEALELKEEIEELEDDLENNNSDIEDKTDEIRELKKENPEGEARKTSIEVEIEELRKEIDELKEENDGIKGEIQEKEDRLKEMDFEDVDQDDYSWEDDICGDLASYGFKGESLLYIIEGSKDIEDAIREMQKNECESCNDAIENIIADIDEFVEDAISADGRGHFLSGYDGVENETDVNGETYYIYRTN